MKSTSLFNDGILAFQRCPNSYGYHGDRFRCPMTQPTHRVTFRDSQSLFFTNTETPPGLVYRTNLYVVKLENMPDGDYGMVHVGRRPFRITLNCNMSPVRIRMSLIHELLHVYCELYKVDLSHEQLHMLAGLIDNEILPSVSALDRYINKR